MVKLFSFRNSSAATAAPDSDSNVSGKHVDEVPPSKWSRAKPYCFWCLRYGSACLVGAIITIAIVLIVLWQIGLFGGKGGDSAQVIGLGDLPYPSVAAGYTELNLTLNPVPSAAQYKPKTYLVETLPAHGVARRFLADGFSDGAWTVALRVNYGSTPAVATLSGLTPSSSVVVRYRIEMDDSRVSTPSIAILATTLSPTAPSAPGLSAFNTSTSSVSVLLVPPRFAHGSVVTSYELKYAPSTGQTPPTRWTSKTIQAGDISKPFTVSGLSTEQTIIFTATAVNGIGSSPASSPYSMKSDANGATAPGKVGTVSASNITSDSVLLKWPSTEDHGAMILRYVISINDTRTVEADGHNTNVTVTGLTRGTYYKFTIRAVNSRGQGEASDPISVKTLDLCNADPPSRPTAQAVFADGISIRWYPPTNPSCTLGITGYRVVWADGTGVACTPSSGLDFCDITGLSNKKTYSVKVQAENAAGWSSSMTKTITATTLDKAPSGVGCNTRDQVRWWMSVQNNDGQSLYYDGQKFTQEMIHCAVSTLGSVDGQAKCLTEYTEDPSRTPFHLKPISADCAHLMGVLGGCGKDKCFQQCFANPAAAACLDCNSRNCNGAFYKAAGLNRAIAPEFPKSR